MCVCVSGSVNRKHCKGYLYFQDFCLQVFNESGTDHKPLNNKLFNFVWERIVTDLLVEVFGVESIPAFGTKQVHCQRALCQALLKQLEKLRGKRSALV